jgi:hypothetical protein
VRFRYRFLDFLTKRLNSKVEVTFFQPTVRWHPSYGIKHDQFPFLRWMREWALSQKNRLRFEVKDLELILGPSRSFKEIDLRYEDDSLEMDIPLRHWQVMGSDVSTEIRLEGRFVLGLAGDDDSLRGEIRTEGTVVNWAPLPQESRFDLVFSHDAIHLNSRDFLGGVAVDGELNFKESEIYWRFTAADWPLSNLSAFLRLGPKVKLPTRVNFDVTFEGSPWAPNMQGRLRLEDGWLGKTEFRALDLHAEGVYPTLRLEDSHVLTKDGVVMKFADTTLEMGDLLNDRTYHELVAGAQQDSVVWGDWALTRHTPENEQADFLMQRSFGKHAKLEFRRFGEEVGYDPAEPKQMEVGFEYHLKSKDSLKVGLRDDEKFVGVEHKMSF